MRSIDWTLPPPGARDTWPRSLRVIVPIMLSSRFAMRVLWGPEFIFLYNDGYRPILGATKHPSAMASRTAESFAEVWDVVGPLFHKVYAGEASALEDTLLSLHRNGYLEECFFTLSYSPITDDDGKIGGVLGVIRMALERIETSRPDVILSDIGMPGEDGYVLIRKVRNGLQTRADRPPRSQPHGVRRFGGSSARAPRRLQHARPQTVDPADLVAIVTSLDEWRER